MTVLGLKNEHQDLFSVICNVGDSIETLCVSKSAAQENDQEEILKVLGEKQEML